MMVYKRITTDLELFYGAKPSVFEKARELRKNMTEAETILWSALRRKNLDGHRFRRQHPIDRFIADFYCHKARLVIEVDGEIHNEDEQKEYDEGRNAELERYGLKVIRFTNEQVKNDLEKVVLEIEEQLQKELKASPLQGRRERG
jgi:very-short-patch-repair endonuclease